MYHMGVEEVGELMQHGPWGLQGDDARACGTGALACSS